MSSVKINLARKLRQGQFKVYAMCTMIPVVYIVIVDIVLNIFTTVEFKGGVVAETKHARQPGLI